MEMSFGVSKFFWVKKFGAVKFQRNCFTLNYSISKSEITRSIVIGAFILINRYWKVDAKIERLFRQFDESFGCLDEGAFNYYFVIFCPARLMMSFL